MFEIAPLTPLQKDLAELDQANRAALSAIKAALLKGKRIFYNSPHGYTPQQMVEAAGTNAARLFQVSALSAQIVSLAEGSPFNVLPEGWGFAANPDGTVTLTPPTE